MTEYQYAGFWIRFCATLIDLLVFLILAGVPLWLIYGASYWSSDTMFNGPWDFIISTVFPMVATVWLWNRFGATPGKMALKLKVLDAHTGENLSVARSIARYFAYLVSTFPLALGYVWVGIDKRKRGFHDLLVGSVVVRDTATEAVSFDADVVD